MRWGTRHGIARAALGLAARSGEVQANIVMNPEVREPVPARYEDLRARGRLVQGRLGLLTSITRSAGPCCVDAAGVAMNPEALPGRSGGR